MRLGLFGGTFDPVHYGHLLLAECCREQCRLDSVWFVPAATPPHKQARELSAAARRIEMLDLAIGGHEQFAVCRLEVERGGVSYTVDTLRELHRAEPKRELFFLMGADSLIDLPTWREPAAICELALPVVVGRPGTQSPAPGLGEGSVKLEPTPVAGEERIRAELLGRILGPLVSPARLDEIRRHQVEMPPLGLSSREIRRRVAAGLSIRYQTPRAVEKYIEAQGLYR
jgi:nicotinate-nucleotide adenylyltransferase